jgi:hypothetical protein
MFVVAATACAGLLCSTAGPFRFVSGQGVSADEANQMLWTNFVPASATDIWFTSGYFATTIDCKLDLTEFQAWCQRKGWNLTPIVAGQPKALYLDRLGDAVLIESGFEFNAKYGAAGRGNAGLYDSRAGRAYVFYAGR